MARAGVQSVPSGEVEDHLSTGKGFSLPWTAEAAWLRDRLLPKLIGRGNSTFRGAPVHHEQTNRGQMRVLTLHGFVVCGQKKV